MRLKTKRWKKTLIKIQNYKQTITIDKMIKCDKSVEKLQVNRFKKLFKMHTFLEKYKMPQVVQKERVNLNRPINIHQNKNLIKDPHLQKTLGGVY